MNRLSQFVVIYCMAGSNTLLPLVSAAENVHSQGNALGHHVVAAGETFWGVARSYGIKPHELLVMNQQFKAYPEQLKVGEVLLVPRNELPSLEGHSQLKVRNDAQVQKGVDSLVAEQTSRLGQAFSQENSSLWAPERKDGALGKAMQEQSARNIKEGGSPQVYGAKDELNYWQQQAQATIEGMVNQKAQSVLGGLGTAKVQIGLRDGVKVNNFSADVLAPLQDSEGRLLFTQFGLRGTGLEQEGRTIANLGLGQRHFVEQWMLGYNAFLDYDLGRGHSRGGLGGEAWTNYLKLNANAYTPLSGWKESKDFDDHEERAAKGFDVRAQAYLPSHPQLGASFNVEQYFGDKVDILSSKQLKKDPYAITAGLDYTPFPLLTLKGGYTTAKGGQEDINVTANFEWKIGATLGQMLDSKQIDRSLQGIRMDLVERNNNIVLEYREVESLKVSLPSTYEAKEMASLQLALVVTSKHEIEHIEWSGAIFDQLGLPASSLNGKNVTSVVLPALPAYRVDTTGTGNYYPVTVKVRDVKGKEAVAYTMVTVQEDSALNPAGYMNSLTLAPGATGLLLEVSDPRQGRAVSRGSALEYDVEYRVIPSGLQDMFNIAIAADGNKSTFTATNDVAPGTYQVQATVRFPSGHELVLDEPVEVIVVDNSVIEPSGISVRVKFTSSASEAVNGLNSIGRPVAGVDVITAECQLVDGADYTICDERFAFQWYSDGVPVSGATKRVYTPGGGMQGQAISVEVVTKP